MYNTPNETCKLFSSACGHLVLTVIQTYYNEPVCIRNSRLVAELNIGVSPAGAARDPALLVAWRSSRLPFQPANVTPSL